MIRPRRARRPRVVIQHSSHRRIALPPLVDNHENAHFVTPMGYILHDVACVLRTRLSFCQAAHVRGVSSATRKLSRKRGIWELTTRVRSKTRSEAAIRARECSLPFDFLTRQNTFASTT